VKGERDPAMLTLNVAIAEVAKLTPTILIWTPGEKPEPKTIEVEAMPDHALTVPKATTSEQNFEVRIIITPKSTEKPELAFLTIEVDSGPGPATQRADMQIAPPAN